jgi:hypothetical protein
MANNSQGKSILPRHSMLSELTRFSSGQTRLGQKPLYLSSRPFDF